MIKNFFHPLRPISLISLIYHDLLSIGTKIFSNLYNYIMRRRGKRQNLLNQKYFT